MKEEVDCHSSKGNGSKRYQASSFLGLVVLHALTWPSETLKSGTNEKTWQLR